MKSPTRLPTSCACNGTARNRWSRRRPSIHVRTTSTCAQHALALDERTASAYGTLGILYLRRWHWEQANVAFQHSLALAPSDAEAIDQYAQYLFACGQFTRAEAEFER